MTGSNGLLQGGDERVDVGGVLGESPFHPLTPLGPVHRRPLALHDLLAPRGDPRGVLHRESEEVDGGVVGKLSGERWDHVDRAGDVERLEERVRPLANELLFQPDRGRVERAHDDPSDPGVLGGVLFSQHAVLGRHRDAGRPEALGTRKVLDVAEDLARFLERRDVVHAFAYRDDRPFGAQLFQALERRLRLFHLERVIGRDHRGFPSSVENLLPAPRHPLPATLAGRRTSPSLRIVVIKLIVTRCSES